MGERVVLVDFEVLSGSSLNVAAECVLDARGASGFVARQDVGYAEPLSAHQLLYPGGEDTRALLLALLSMLPPEGVRPVFACLSPIFLLLLAARYRMRIVGAFSCVGRRSECWEDVRHHRVGFILVSR